MSEQADRSLERRLAEIEDRAAIADLIHRHAEHIRAGTIAVAADLFTADAVYEMGRFHAARPGEFEITDRIEGAAAIVGCKDEVAGAGIRLCPMIHNIVVVLSGDTAEATCVSMATLWPTGDNFVGEYRDAFRREAGRWRFARRRFLGFGSIDGTYAEQAHALYQTQKKARSPG